MRKIYGFALAMLFFVAFASAQQLQSKNKAVQSSAAYDDMDKAKELGIKKQAIEALISDKQDASPVINVNPRGSKAAGDILLDLDVQTPASHVCLLGVEFDGTNIWVTSGGATSSADPNMIFKYSTTGTLLNTYSQTTTSTWGLRDFAFDGTYLYAGDDNGFYQIDPATGTSTTLVTGTPTGTGGCIRALAWDPTNNSFWTKNFANSLVNFSVSGGAYTVLGTYTVTEAAAAYGMAYDPNNGSPCLWIFDQSGTPQTTFIQWDITTHASTGLAYVVPLLSGGTEQLAGGAFFNANDLVAGKVVLGGLVQGTPLDRVFAMELRDGILEGVNGAISSLISPANGVIVNNAVPVTIALNNFGTADIDTFQVYYQVDANPIVSDIFVPDSALSSGETINYTFADSADLSSFDTYQVKAWIVVAGDTNNADDTISVDITTTPLNDVGVTQILRPNTGPNLTAAEPIKVVVKNFGGAAQSNIPVRFYLDGTLVAEETLAGPLDAGDTVHFTFTATADLSAVTTYDIAATTANPGDAIPANDSIASSVINQGNVILMQAGTVNACSGTFYDTGGPSGPYQANEDITMTIMPSTAGAKVQYNFISYATESGFDYLKIFDGDNTSAPAIHTGNGFNGTTVPTTYIATSASGALTFQFTSDGSVQQAGWEAQISCMIPADTNMTAVKLMGNAMPTQGAANTYEVVVRNLGSDDISGYTVALYDATDNLISSAVVSDVLANMEYDTIALDWTPAAAGLTHIYGIVTVDNDADTTDNQTADFDVDVQPEGVVVVNIGDSTGMVNTIPFDFFYKNSMAQTIYFPDEIGIGGGLISKVIYHNNFVTASLTSTPIKIWIGETTQTNFAGGASAWIDADDLTLVYDGNAAFPAGQNEIVINLTTPYIYQGGNLVICTNRPMDAAYYSSSDRFYVSANAAHAQRSIEFHADATTYDPSNPPTTGGNVLNIHPNTGLVFYTSGLGHIEGTVTDIVSGDSIAGANIKILGGTAQANTNANGHYAFNYQVPDTVEFVTSKFGYYNDTTEVIILADSTVYYDIALTPLPQVAVTGVVQTNDNMGVGLQGAVVVLEGYATYTDTTDANGVFALVDVWGEKTYNITITYPGYATYTNTVVVGATAVDLDTITITEILYPAKNVLAIDMEDSVQVIWRDPSAVTGNPQWIQWCDEANADAIGTGGAANFDVAARFEPADIADMDGMQITQIRFYPNEAAATYSVRVWTGSGATLAYEQVVSSPTIGAYNIINLTSPVTIDASQELWIGYNVNATTGYPAGCDAGPEVAGKGNMIYWSGVWQELTALNAALTYNWNIMGYVDNAKALSYNTKVLQGYNVYRGLSGDEPNVAGWTAIANTTDTTVIDNNWDTCAPAVYKYAVRAIYSGGVEAPAAFSNPLAKDMFVPFTVNLTTNSGDPVTGAVVTLNNVDNDTTYTMTATSAAVLFPAVWRGHYDITVQLTGFETIDTANIDITNAGTIALQLIEIIENPFGLNVSTTGLPMGQAMMEWNVSYGFSDNFDSYSSFALSFGNWTLVDVDNKATYGFSGVTFPNSGSPMAGIIFNPDSTTPPITTSPAYSGTKYLAVFNPADATACNDWVISPKTMVPSNGQVSFWARGGHESYSAEVFQVFVSTTNTTPASFVALSPIVTCPAGSIDWVQYTYSLSAYQGQEVYVGIHVTSVDQFYFCVDDFAIGAPVETKAFLGYDVYLDDMVTPIATGVDSTHYLLTGLALGQHVAGVKAVYTTGSSIMITDTFEIVQTYSVTYNVTSNGTTPVEGATVALTGYGTQTTNASGVAVFNGVLAAPSPGIAWTASKAGHVAQNGNVIVDGNEVVNVTMPFTPYNVTFTVRSTYNIPISGATIAIPGQTSQTTNTSGQAVFSLINGAYTYTVSYPHDTVTGNFTVNGANLPVNVIVTGIGEMQQVNKFTIYPNPAKDVLYINSENMIDNIKVVDMLGNVVFQGEVNDSAIKLITTTYQAGLYLIYMESKQQMYIKKIQIVK